VTGETRPGRIYKYLEYLGLERSEVPVASAGDIVAITGIEALKFLIRFAILKRRSTHALTVDEPTVSMTFQVNTSPFAGRRKICYYPKNP